jgi:hypothetical protein
MQGPWVRSPKLAVVGIALLLFAIVVALESSGMGVIVLGLAVVGLFLALIA